ncbi:hypothetical protein GCM10008107_23670 [Psychrosphaera saromensis]|uniref:Glycosyl transferase family 25 domain-containing protein n=1 Tax=Psychrosphaera saromensis TaxID=716813 RepID=A0A2S7USE8_9GAMM|nr:glycosyltransferase family 25 protein [Psychrosphaera saromensis]PQJ52402.1 hypothetical protein BTO11_01200 [Psychrosphaera saromensis]GHB73468.1 hypothetical protein GCM10008107_23670 [Psychrosphaera saromensis]GLQ13430.1 hypothetical protein GCM10007917_08850 [Psychrosphaera saromensis]
MKFKVFLINLDKSTDRLELCKKELEKFGVEFERVAAVYGKDLSQQQVDDVYNADNNYKLYKKSLSLGEIGCYLSHITCWQKIIDESLDYAVILEDDFILSDSFKDFESLLTQLKNWDYIRLAFSSREVPALQRTEISDSYDLVKYEKTPINTLAQVVSNQGAIKLVANSQQIFRPVDVDFKHYWEKNINVLGIDPPLIKQQNSETSETSEISKIAAGKGRAEKSSTWRNIKYAISFYLKNRKQNNAKLNLSQFIKNN